MSSTSNSRTRNEQEKRALRVLLLCTAATLALFTYVTQTWDNPNVRSRLATAQSLVEGHTFRIDDSPFASTLDKVYVDGHFYSDKSPLLAVMAAAVYAPLHAAGLELRSDSLFVLLSITFAIHGLSFLLCLGCFEDALGRAGLPPRPAIWMTAMLAFGTLCLPFNITLNNHASVASWIFIGFYGLLRARSDPRRRWMALAGVAFALAVGADYSVAIFLAAFTAYAIARPELRSRVLFLVFPVLLVIAAGAVYDYAIAGSVLPLQVRPELFHYPGSLWNDPNARLSGATYNSPWFALRYAAQMLFGRDGFLLYSPLLLLAIATAARQILRRGPMWIESALALGSTGLFLAYYSVFSSGAGGCSYSVRWFVCFIPLLWFFAFPAFVNWTRASRVLILSLFAVAFFISVMGCFNPWQCGKPTFTTNLRQWRIRVQTTHRLFDL